MSDKKCPYCEAENNDFIPVNQTVDYSGIEIALNRWGELRVRTFPNCEIPYFDSQDIVQVKFCPLCGRRVQGA